MRMLTRFGAAIAAASIIPTIGISSLASANGGGGGKPPPCAITVSPNPALLTGQSEVHVVVQVECTPNLSSSGTINIGSTQLAADCAQVEYHSIAPGIGNEREVEGPPNPNQIGGIYLDNDGNATVKVDATGCQAGTDLFTADLTGPPFTTATTKLVVQAPVTTKPGVIGYPTSTKLANGTVVKGEVETGDTVGVSGDSDVYAMFQVEVPPVYAEQTVQITSNELESRCIKGFFWEAGNNLTDDADPTPSTGAGVVSTATIDNNGNATFDFFGESCAAGTSHVIVDILAGTHKTYTTTFTILPPQRTW